MYLYLLYTFIEMPLSPSCILPLLALHSPATLACCSHPPQGLCICCSLYPEHLCYFPFSPLIPRSSQLHSSGSPYLSLCASSIGLRFFPSAHRAVANCTLIWVRSDCLFTGWEAQEGRNYVFFCSPLYTEHPVAPEQICVERVSGYCFGKRAILGTMGAAEISLCSPCSEGAFSLIGESTI